MKDKKKFSHPYIPNSEAETQAAMLKEIGLKDIDQLYEDIPQDLRYKGKMNLPSPLLSELALERHIRSILAKNKSCQENINFLGGSCWQHYVPAICDEINQRSEFLTAYAGEPYEDHGRFQALFEYQSLMAELLDMDVVNVPTYDWSQAASTSLRMASRITRRSEVLVVDTLPSERMLVIENYCRPLVTVNKIKHWRKSGLMDVDDLQSKISSQTAAIYFENPSYLGFIETQGKKIAEIAHGAGALVVVGVDPISLGILTPPSQYGADIVCGDIQPLGVHLHYGGGLGGFIATRDEEKYVMEYPSRLFGITKTCVEGEYGFGDVAYERTSFAEREEGKEFVGTHAALWGITAAVYLSLMGPKGMQELGVHLLRKSRYAMSRLSEIKGIEAPYFKSPHFKEFVVGFRGTGKNVAEINKALREKNIFGGKDLSSEFKELNNCALYCLTEIHTKEDIDFLIQSLKDCLK